MEFGLPGEEVDRTTLEGQLQCYAIPYGGMGFVSHLLLAYTYLCVATPSRAPLWPWRTSLNRPYSIALWVTTLFGQFGLNLYHIVLCHFGWQLSAVTAGKLLLNLFWGIFAIVLLVKGMRSDPGSVFSSSAARQSRSRRRQAERDHFFAQMGGAGEDASRRRRDPRRKKMMETIFIVVGVTYNVMCFALILAGAVDMAAQRRTPGGSPATRERTISFVFAIAMGLMALSAIINVFLAHYIPVTKDGRSGFEYYMAQRPFSAISSAVILGFCIPSYADWIIASIVGRLSGIPPGEATIRYWLYFGLTKLPLGMW
jgi:hypothetical protein